MKNKEYVGLVLGTTMFDDSFTLTIANTRFVVLSTVLKSTFGGLLSSQLIKDNSEFRNNKVRSREDIKWRVKALMELFGKIDDDQELGGVVLTRILNESKDSEDVNDQIKGFLLSKKCSAVIEEELDLFESLCEEHNDKAIIDTIFTFLIPLQKLLKNKNSISKRLASLIWRFISFIKR